jgi:antitoxin VapB
MPLNVKDDATHEAARELAKLTGESITQAVRVAIRERLDRIRRTRGARPLAERIKPITARCAARPVLDSRSEDAILGYDDAGVPD